MSHVSRMLVGDWWSGSRAGGVFSKCLSLIHHNDSYAFETGTRFYTPNAKGVNYKFKTESQYSPPWPCPPPPRIHFRLYFHYFGMHKNCLRRNREKETAKKNKTGTPLSFSLVFTLRPGYQSTDSNSVSCYYGSYLDY